MKLEILQTDSVIGSPVYPFFLRSMANLMDDKFTWNRKTWIDKDLKAVYATINSVVVGHIAYEYKPVNCSLWITLSAVDKNYRGQGIYKKMHVRFEEIAREMNCALISSGVHVNNRIRLESAKAVDLFPNKIFMVKKL